MARKRKGRNVSGIFLLDKNKDISSNRALQKVKSIYFAKKAGHTGSLDPLASGLLPICFGEATKVSAFLLNADKKYTAVCKLGEKTSTGDREGEIIQCRSVPVLSESQIQVVLRQFTGRIKQIPPMHSALKHNGVRLYQLAHEGVEVERQPREIEIYALSLLNRSADQLTLQIHCSKGTYIRTLVEDIGEALGCGAHVADMRRTHAGPFDISHAVTLQELEDLGNNYPELNRLILPIEAALEQWPAVELSDSSGFYLKQGQAVFVPHAPSMGWVRIYLQGHRFLGMGQILDDGRVAPKRLFNAI